MKINDEDYKKAIHSLAINMEEGYDEMKELLKNLGDESDVTIDKIGQDIELEALRIRMGIKWIIKRKKTRS